MAQVDDITRRWISGFTIVLFLFSEVLGFNLDIKAPIIKEGRSTSYFGYSIAHHLVKSRATDVSESVILVGAPRDNITDATAHQKVRQLVRPGAVYQCPYSSLRNDCVAVKLDIEAPRSDEDKNDQWMGVSVSSQGTEDGKALACAHRYKKAGASFRWGLGICVSLSNVLDEDNFWEPCDGLKKDIGHGEYGFCQAGISSAVSEDGEFLLGAPGPYNWRGALFKNTLVTSLYAENTFYQSPVEDPTLLNPGPFPATPYYSYLGMSVKIGKIINGMKTYVGGAPRANDTGHVLLFQMEGDSLAIKPEHYLVGEQFGSYFGHDFAIGDFNLDGKEDIAIGAPFYRDHGVGGAIYIYMNGPEGITSKTKPLKIVSRKLKDLECAELDCLNARFGFALANIGDVDRDGFDDLAVGAPYEGNGAVYIFRGSASGIIKEYSQRISASHFLPKPQAFGASIAGNFDIDSNGYPDIVVGAFVSDEVFVLRARPVVNVMTVLQSIPETIDPKLTQCAKDGQLMNCFEVKVCFRFKAEPVDRFRDKIELNYTLEAEKFTGAVISRVAFKVPGKDDTEKTDVIERTMRLNEQSKPDFKCREHIVYILKNNKDFLSPIAFQLTYRLQDAEDPVLVPGRALPDMNSYPVLNDVMTKIPLTVNFLKNCGQDELCHSNLKLTSTLNLNRDPNGDYVLRVGQDDVDLIINVQNTGEDAHEATVVVVHPKFLSYRGTDEEGKKYSCTPVENTVVCILGNPLPQNQNVTFTIRLDTANAVPSRDKFDISVNVSTTSVELNQNDDKAKLKFRVVVETDLHVIGDSDPKSIYFGGEVRGESAIKFEDQIGSEITHSYEIKNIGRARVSKSTVFVSWPYELQSTYPMGKHVLYILEEPWLQSEGGRCYFEKSWINPLNIKVYPDKKLTATKTRLPPPPVQEPNTTHAAATEESQNRFRRRREVESSSKVERSTDLRRQITFVNIDCEENSAKCYRFNCSLGELLPGKSAVLKIRARLWNSTFLEDFSHLDEIRISSIAEVKIDPSLNIHQMNLMNDIKKITTTAKPEVQEPEPVPIWVIIVAVIAGVILLAVIILLLCKCGFFRRQQRDQMIQHKAKMERKSYDEYHD